MNNLGICFQKGEGVEQNWTMAVEWYANAVDHGRTKAEAYLEHARRMMQNNDE
jgi:TPR repeat protein